MHLTPLHGCASKSVGWRCFNNAGVMYGYGLAVVEARARSEEEAQTNLLGSLRMTRLALPFLQDAQDAAVVFLSSALALAPGAPARSERVAVQGRAS